MIYDAIDPWLDTRFHIGDPGSSVDLWAKRSGNGPVPFVVAVSWRSGDDYVLIGIDPAEPIGGTGLLASDQFTTVKEWIELYRSALLAHWRDELYNGELWDIVYESDINGIDEEEPEDDVGADPEWEILCPHSTGLPMPVWISQRTAAGYPPHIRVARAHRSDVNPADAIVVVIGPEIEPINGDLNAPDIALVTAWIGLNRTTLLDVWTGKLWQDELAYRLQRLECTGQPAIDDEIRTPIEACAASFKWPMTGELRHMCDSLASYSYFIIVDNCRLAMLQDNIEVFCHRLGCLEQDWTMGHISINADALSRFYCVFAFTDRSQQAAVLEHFRSVAHCLALWPSVDAA